MEASSLSNSLIVSILISGSFDSNGLIVSLWSLVRWSDCSLQDPQEQENQSCTFLWLVMFLIYKLIFL